MKCIWSRYVLCPFFPLPRPRDHPPGRRPHQSRVLTPTPLSSSTCTLPSISLRKLTPAQELMETDLYVSFRQTATEYDPVLTSVAIA